MKKHSSPLVFLFELLLGLVAAVACAEIAIQFNWPAFYILSLAIVMVIALWILILLPHRVSKRERRRMELIMELQNLQDALDDAIQLDRAGVYNALKAQIEELKSDPDFKLTSWD